MKFYIRTSEGETRYVDSLREGLVSLSDPTGYRLTITDDDGAEIIIRRYTEIIPGHIPEDLVYENVNVVIRGIKS